jgi:broad specificity phosphatase PhoE
MPVLSDDRHERFAQGLAKGLSQADAYIDAGFKSKNRQSAAVAANSLLKKKADLKDRVHELEQLAREHMLNAEFKGSIEELAKLFLDDRLFARQQGQAGAAVSASAQLMKLFEKGAENTNNKTTINLIERKIVEAGD